MMANMIKIEEEKLQKVLEALVMVSGHVNNEVFVKVMMARDTVAEAMRRSLLKKAKDSICKE